MRVARHGQITQNNKFVISLEYLQKEMSDEVDFLNANKHKSLLQIYTMILMWMVKYFWSFQNKFVMSLQYLRKSVRDEVGYLLADKHQYFSILAL